jgi:hypothetical protein
MMYVVHVEQNALRASSDPMEAATALKVAKAWQSHGDRGVRILEAPAGRRQAGAIRPLMERQRIHRYSSGDRRRAVPGSGNRRKCGGPLTRVAHLQQSRLRTASTHS